MRTDLGFHSLNNILLQAFSRLHGALLRSLDLLGRGELFVRGVVGEDTRNLYDAHEAEEEVYGCEPAAVSAGLVIRGEWGQT